MHIFYIGLLFLCCQAVTIKNHIKGGIGMRDTRPGENTLILTLTHNNLQSKEDFFERLGEKIEEDDCSLSFSGMSKESLVLTIYCAKLNNTIRMNAIERSPLPPLESTRQFLKDSHYTLQHTEYIQSIKKPSNWYGNYDNLDSVLHQYFERVHEEKYFDRQKINPVHGSFVEYLAPWGLDRIDMRFGLLDNEYNYNNLGESVDIYVIDSGIRLSHSEFQGRAKFLINTVGDTIDTDCAGHGTHVASLSGGLKYGAAKGVTLWSVKVLDCAGFGNTFTVLTGIMAAIDHSKTRQGRRGVASLSLGGDLSVTINNAVLSLSANNIVTVVAAGNDYGNACDYSPSILGGSTDIITVGASTMQDTRPAWSNYGACVTISAPGVGIIGASFQSDSGSVVLQGTSMATPFVSGVLALILNQNLSLSVRETKSILKSWATASIITGTSSDGGGKNLLYSLISLSQQSPPPPPLIQPRPSPPPPTTTFIVPQNPITRNAGHASATTLTSMLLFLILFIVTL
jgi:subtilisin family serine protease